MLLYIFMLPILVILLPMIFFLVKSVFTIGSFSLKTAFIPVRHFLAIILRWGKFLAIPLGLLMLMYPAEFSVGNGKLYEKLGILILVIGAVYLVRSCIRGFGQIAAVAVWCVICLVGAGFAGQAKFLDPYFSRKKESNVYFVPFMAKKRSVYNSANCANDCLERIVFLSDTHQMSLRNEVNSKINFDYFLGSNNISIVDRFDSMYKKTTEPSYSLPDEAFFGRSSKPSTLSSFKDQVVTLVKKAL